MYKKKTSYDLPLAVLMLLVFTLGAMTAASMQFRGAAESFTEGDTSHLLPGFVFSLVIGVLFGAVLCFIGAERIEKYSLPILVGGLLLTAVTFTPLGYSPDQSDDRAWLRFGGFSFQPSEVLKLCFIISFAAHLNRIGKTVNRPSSLTMLILHAAIPTGIVWLQGDQGSAVVFLFIAASMLINVGLDGRLFAAMLALLPAVGFAVWKLMLAEHQKQRILTVLDPSLDPEGTGFQQIQARRAFASGGLTGNGMFSLGGDTVYVSQSQNDFVLSYIGRTGGLLLTSAVVILLFMLVFRLIVVSGKRGGFKGLVCAGASGLFFAHTLINTGMELGIMPVIGLPLPFVSAGGTARAVMTGLIMFVMSEPRKATTAVI